MTYEPRREKKEKIPMSDIPSDWKYLCRKIRYFAWQLRHKWSVRLKARRTEQEMKRFVIVAVSLLMMVGFCDDRGIVKVRGRGTGTDKTEALKDAYRDAIEKAIGLYVDAEQMVKNEELVKDQILTQSNAYIEKYNIVIEGKSPSGLVTITILAEVRKRDLARKIKDIMPSQQVNLSDVSKNLHAQIVTDFKANEDALSIIKNELKVLSPVKQLMKASLGATKPVVEAVKEDPSLVRLWYPVKIEVDPDKYYKEFVPRWNRILDQIKTAPAKRFDLKNELKYVNEYKAYIVKKHGTSRMQKSGVMTCCNEVRNMSSLESSDPLSTYGIALNEEYKTTTFLSVQINGRNYVLHGHGIMGNAYYYNGWGIRFSDRLGERMSGARFVRRRFSGNIPESCTFDVGIVKTARGYTLSGCLYRLSYKCWEEIVRWQNYFLSPETSNKYPDYAPNATVTTYALSFKNTNGDEVAGTSIVVRNIDILNFATTILEHGDDYVGQKRLWFISPLVGGFAKSYVKWVSIDIPMDDVAKIVTASISVEE